MANDIKLSKKYGLNPTIPVCAFCGESKNEIALMGHIGDYRKGEDFEAPLNAILDYDPCDKCKERWEQGVAIIEVSRTPNVPSQPPIVPNAYPTGRYAVVDERALTGDYHKGDKAFMTEEDYEAVFGD